MAIAKVQPALDQLTAKTVQVRPRAPQLDSSTAKSTVRPCSMMAAIFPVNRPGRPGGGWYRRSVDATFSVFSATRLLTYVPTMYAIYASADSSQHSLTTWLAWIASNATMSLWLFENNQRRFDLAVVVSIGNALMCLVTCGLIIAFRR